MSNIKLSLIPLTLSALLMLTGCNTATEQTEQTKQTETAEPTTISAIAVDSKETTVTFEEEARETVEDYAEPQAKPDLTGSDLIAAFQRAYDEVEVDFGDVGDDEFKLFAAHSILKEAEQGLKNGIAVPVWPCFENGKLPDNFRGLYDEWYYANKGQEDNSLSTSQAPAPSNSTSQVPAPSNSTQAPRPTSTSEPPLDSDTTSDDIQWITYGDDAVVTDWAEVARENGGITDESNITVLMPH